MSDWVPEPRPVPPELLEDYEAPPYNDPFLGSVMDRLDKAMRERLEAFKLIGGGIGDPE